MSAWRDALLELVRLAQESLPTVDSGVGDPCYEAGVIDKVMKPNKVIMRHIEAVEAERDCYRKVLEEVGCRQAVSGGFLQVGRCPSLTGQREYWCPVCKALHPEGGES